MLVLWDSAYLMIYHFLRWWGIVTEEILVTLFGYYHVSTQTVTDLLIGRLAGIVNRCRVLFFFHATGILG